MIQEYGDEATTENVEQWWEEIAEQIKKCGEELCGRSTGKKKPGLESWWWNDETESAVKEKKERLKIWKRTVLRRKRQGRVQDSEGEG